MKIEWNKVTWYSKLLALVIFVALPFIGFYYGAQYGKTVAAIGQTSTSSVTAQTTSDNGTAYYSDPAEWQTDANNVPSASRIQSIFKPTTTIRRRL